jgi:hypothetical protein
MVRITTFINIWLQVGAVNFRVMLYNTQTSHKYPKKLMWKGLTIIRFIFFIFLFLQEMIQTLLNPTKSTL